MGILKKFEMVNRKIESVQSGLRVLIGANAKELGDMRKELDTLRQAVHHPKVDDPDRPKNKLKVPPKPEIGG